MKRNQVKVSILTISYNQEKYISQALESFVHQRVKFPFEIIIADDGSTDNTQKIIREYEKSYPSLFNNILRKNNIGAVMNLKDAILHANGEYIALCEGDDFWTDMKKLQKQVDFMDSNRDYSVCFHPVRVFFENNEQKDEIFPKRTDNFTVKDLLGENFIQTNSVLYRAQNNYKNLAVNMMPYDYYLHLYHAQFGKIGFIDEVMADYRRHEGGIWWNTHKERDEIWKRYGLDHMAVYLEVLKMYENNKTYKDIVTRHITQLIRILVRIDSTYKTTLVSDCLSRFSDQNKPVSKAIVDVLSEIYKTQEELKHEISTQKHEISTQKKYLNDMISEINDIKSSKRYKYAQRAAQLKTKLKVK